MTNNTSLRYALNWVKLIVGVASICVLTACEVEDTDGDVINTVPLPLDFLLDLHCDDAGVGFEDCVLDDPENPFANVAMDDDIKFSLFQSTPSNKASFYIWATAQAKSPRGENQWYTARALHELYAEALAGVTDIAEAEYLRLQAIKAYRAALDNHFNEVTFFGDATNGFFPAKINLLVAADLYLPVVTSHEGLLPLFANDVEALGTFGEWGYTYDTTTGGITRNF